MTDHGICPCCGDWTVLVEDTYLPTNRKCKDCHEHER